MCVGKSARKGLMVETNIDGILRISQYFLKKEKNALVLWSALTQYGVLANMHCDVMVQHFSKKNTIVEKETRE